MSVRDFKATRYVQDAMFPHIVNAVRQEEPCFTQYDLKKAYMDGWNEAIKSLWTITKESLPEYEQEVIVLDSDGDVYFCHRSNNENVITDNDGWCRYTESPIIAWMEIPSFNDI